MHKKADTRMPPASQVPTLRVEEDPVARALRSWELLATNLSLVIG